MNCGVMLLSMEVQPSNLTPLRFHIEQLQKHFAKVHDAKGSASGMGQFLLHVQVTAVTETIYIPLSISSGKKPTGFTYQIEGTGESAIVTTDISLRDVKESGVTQILLGTITYVEIPKDMTATFRIRIDFKGKIGEEYAIAITRLEYKNKPSDARYQKYVEETRTDTLRFH